MQTRAARRLRRRGQSHRTFTRRPALSEGRDGEERLVQESGQLWLYRKSRGKWTKLETTRDS